jgi:hypothetical protein
MKIGPKRINIAADLPIVLILLYLAFTLLAFLAMRTSETPNVLLTLFYASASYLLLLLGYLSRRRVGPYRAVFDGPPYRLVVMVSAILTLVVSISTIFIIYPNLSAVLHVIASPGDAYEYTKRFQRLDDLTAKTSTESFVGVILTSLSFTKYLFAGFALFYWQKLGWKLKSLAIVALILYCLQTYLVGAMINVASFFLAVLPFLFVRLRLATKGISRRAGILFAGLFLVVGIVLVVFLGSRNAFSWNGRNPGILLSGILGLLFYVSHGYTGLAYCLALPFVPTWGYTTFYGLASTIFPHLGVGSLFDSSYLVRNFDLNGWDAQKIWSTIFPWLASDLSFYLVPIVFFGIGYLMKKFWNESVLRENPFAMALLGQFFLLCFMIPANNFLFKTYGNSVGVISIAIIYLLSNRKTMKRVEE